MEEIDKWKNAFALITSIITNCGMSTSRVDRKKSFGQILSLILFSSLSLFESIVQ